MSDQPPPPPGPAPTAPGRDPDADLTPPVESAFIGPFPWHYGWNVVALTLVMQSISVGILVYCYALFAVPWIDEFDATRRDAMMAVSLLQLAGGLFSPFAGRLMERVSLRRLVIFGAAMIAAGLMLASQATALWQIICLYAVLLPAGNVLCGTLAAQTLVTRWFRRRRGLAIGISATGTSLGGFLFPYVADWLIGDLGWRMALMLLGGAAFLIIAPLAALVLARRPPARVTQATVAAAGAPAAEPVRVVRWSTVEILRSSMFWLPVGAFIPLNAGFGAVQFNLGAYTRDLGMPSGTAAFLISVTSVAMMAGKLVWGSLGDRRDHRVLYWVAAMSLIGAMLAFQWAPGMTRMVSGAVMLGVATGAVLPLMAVIYASRFGDLAFSRVMGLSQMFFMMGAAGPLIAGWVYDWRGSYDPAFMGLAILAVPLAIAMFWLPPPRHVQH